MTLQGIDILVEFVRQNGKLGLPPLKHTLYWKEYSAIRLWPGHGFAAPAGRYIVMENRYEDTEEEYLRFCAQRDIIKADALKILQRLYARLKRLRIKGTRVDLAPLGTFFNKDDRLCFVPAAVEWHESYYGLPIVQLEPHPHTVESKAMAVRRAQDKNAVQSPTISYDSRQERFWIVALSFCLIAILIMGYALLQSTPPGPEGSYFIKGADHRESIHKVFGLVKPVKRMLSTQDPSLKKRRLIAVCPVNVFPRDPFWGLECGEVRASSKGPGVRAKTEKQCLKG